MTPEQIKAAWEVIGKATPEPWTRGEDNDLGDYCIWGPTPGDEFLANVGTGIDQDGKISVAFDVAAKGNADFFAAARTGWPAALKEVERLQNAIWPGLPKFAPTPEKPQQDFHEALIESVCATCNGTRMIDQHDLMIGNATDLAPCPDCSAPQPEAAKLGETHAQFVDAGPFNVTVAWDEEADVFVGRLESIGILSQGKTEAEATAATLDAASLRFAYLRDQCDYDPPQPAVVAESAITQPATGQTAQESPDLDERKRWREFHAAQEPKDAA